MTEHYLDRPRNKAPTSMAVSPHSKSSTVVRSDFPCQVKMAVVTITPPATTTIVCPSRFLLTLSPVSSLPWLLPEKGEAPCPQVRLPSILL
jgi:hypothetical protein